MKNNFSILVVGSLILQLSFGTLVQAQAAGGSSPNLIGQLETDNCAWWSTSNPSACTSQTSSTSTNPDPWNWNDDPTWNYNGPDNGSWGSYDPNQFGYSGSFAGGMYSPQPAGFLEKQMMGVLTANYTALVIQDLNGRGIWDSEAVDAAADRIIAKYSKVAAAWAVMASAGVYMLDWLFLDKWRMAGGWYAGSIGMFGAGMAGAMIMESFKVMQAQLTMIMELMELYGELPVDFNQRANEVAIALNMSLGETFMTGVLNRAIGLEKVTPPTPPIPPLPPVDPTLPASTFMGETGAATAANATKATEEVMARTGMLKAATSRFGLQKVGQFFVEHPALSNVAKATFATAFAAATNYGLTRYMGNNTKKKFRKASKEHLNNIIEDFQNNPDAKHAVWLILTKSVFKPDPTDISLSDSDQKLYASIISQEIPLLHFGPYNESDSLFKKYKQSAKFDLPSAPVPAAPVAPAKSKKDPVASKDKTKTPSKDPKDVEKEFNPFTNDPSDVDFNLGSSSTGSSRTSSSSPGTKVPNEIDRMLMRLNRDFDPQAKLHLVRLVESGMLMKGFLSPRDTDTLETVAIELGLTPPAQIKLKDIDPRKLLSERYLMVRNGLNGEVKKRVLAEAAAKGITGDDGVKQYERNLPPGDLRYRAGEIVLEEYFDPEIMALRKIKQHMKDTGLKDQKDINDMKQLQPYLEGTKKLPPVTQLPPHTADGSPKATVQQPKN